ncbi:MAG: DUF1501 domain-containing protein [Planctomycetes bacterium]|nr:DUF1501 domain-containing protein [Planctomycetota bacterium]
MNWNRREFLKAGALTSALLGLNAFSPRFLKRALLGAPLAPNKKMILIFLRGGNDGVNTVIPRGDPEYNDTNRPTLYIAPDDAINLGIASPGVPSFAQLHPMMGSLMDIYNSAALTGTAGDGNLAVIHRVGYSGQSQSHFDSQQYWENGQPGRPYDDEGMFYRLLDRTGSLDTGDFVAASLSGSELVALNGRRPVPAISNPRTFKLAGTAAKVQKFLGQLPSAPQGTDGKGLLGLYGGPRDYPAKTGRVEVYETGTVLVQAVNLMTEITKTTYIPENGSAYPTNGFGQKLMDCAMIFKRIPTAQILGVNIGGFDTHVNQGQIYGYHGSLLQSLAEGIAALRKDLSAVWGDLVVMTMTEFGRTSIENGSLGTDHAYSSVVFAAGGKVKGGVYNCDASTWAPGDLFSQSGRYVRRKTDYRNVVWEILEKHFGVSTTMREQILPGYGAAATANPGDFAALNFMLA